MIEINFIRFIWAPSKYVLPFITETYTYIFLDKQHATTENSKPFHNQVIEENDRTELKVHKETLKWDEVSGEMGKWLVVTKDNDPKTYKNRKNKDLSAIRDQSRPKLKAGVKKGQNQSSIPDTRNSKETVTLQDQTVPGVAKMEAELLEHFMQKEYSPLDESLWDSCPEETIRENKLCTEMKSESDVVEEDQDGGVIYANEEGKEGEVIYANEEGKEGEVIYANEEGKEGEVIYANEEGKEGEVIYANEEGKEGEVIYADEYERSSFAIRGKDKITGKIKDHSVCYKLHCNRVICNRVIRLYNCITVVRFLYFSLIFHF